MRNDMYENRWSPFDPQWYQAAFDKFISNADMLFNQETIIEQGYHIPDSDGSKSSVFRNEAVLNNSFNEKDLREALKDIYLNNSNKLIASNHDNVHFFQWAGNISDMEILENTNECQFKVPTETFINSGERDVYKLSQFYRKWIKVEDILNNWNVFKWHCLLFIDQRVYSEYQLRIDDHKTTIKFKFYDHWLKNNYSVYLYKFDTSASCRIKISSYLCKWEWDWHMPVKYIDDQRVVNSPNILVAINKISDPDIRKDELTNIEVLGDNLEFLKIEDGYIDLTKLSNFNKTYIESESKEWLWMSIFVPKFFNEYPILLPTESIYRPYEANFQPVSIIDHETVQKVKSKYRDTEEKRQVYADMNDELKNIHNGWKTLIRPVVLADAFDKTLEPYDDLVAELNNLRDLTVKGADIVENFRFYVDNYRTDEEFKQFCVDLKNIMYSIREAHNKFLDRMLIEYNQEYEVRYKEFTIVMDEIDVQGVEHELFTNVSKFNREDQDFWFFISPLIYIPRELADKYYVINIINDMDNNQRVLWANMDELFGQLRFQRPIEVSDFWTFEYYPDDQVWRPYPLSIEHHFPDVYILKDPKEDEPTLNRIYKSFFFYSDTMNVLNESQDIVRASADWTKDVEEFHFDQEATYRDIFMEKFYWMGVRAIYRGLLKTENRWEAIEYVIDNPSYERFNQLFLKTMDPYFKLGLATFLKSDNYEFPFDDAIDKIKEAINTSWLGYKKITNFELYLNKNWIPSYFDYIVKIMDNFDYSNKLIRRPRSTFDISRLLPIILDVQNDLYDAMGDLVSLIDWIVEQLEKEDYNINVGLIKDLRVLVYETYDNICEVYDFTKNLDLDIYSIDDVNYIIEKLRKHVDLTNKLKTQFSDIYDDVILHLVYDKKREVLKEVEDHIKNLPELIDKIINYVNTLDMEKFMKAANDLQTYFIYNKVNPEDNSLLYHINQFEDPWSLKVKMYRNKLFVSSTQLYGRFDSTKVYSNEEVTEYVELIKEVKSDIKNLEEVIHEFYDNFGYKEDESLFIQLEDVYNLLDSMTIGILNYYDNREKFLAECDLIKEIINKMLQYNIGETEKGYIDSLFNQLDIIRDTLSHIAGENRKEDTDKAYNELLEMIKVWNHFLNIEEEVFDGLIRLSKVPVKFIVILEDHQDMVLAIIDYMDTVNIEYKPDSELANYSDIFEIEEIELETNGFRYEIGENIFAPGLGSFVVSEINEEKSEVKAIELLNYRNTTFRNPMWQYRPYDTISDKKGVGVYIKPTKVKHTRLINDNAATVTVMKVDNSYNLITKYSQIINPHNDNDFNYIIEDIDNIVEDWNKILDVYYDYFSPEVRDYTNDIVSLLVLLVNPCKEYVNLRSTITISELIGNLEKFIYKVYDFIESHEYQTEAFYYYDNDVRERYNELYNFYGSGNTWSDEKLLRKILSDIIASINLYDKKIFINIEDSVDLEDVKNDMKSIIDHINSIISALDNLPMKRIDIDSNLSLLKEKLLNKVDTTGKDVWYNIKSVSVAEVGADYKAGDIVELVQELPTDSNGDFIHVAYEDVLMKDVILLKITEVDDGRVTKVEPFHNYALPYPIWGVRKAKTRVGKGHGLSVDIFGFEVELSDSTILNPVENQFIDPFDTNDLFTFKFENIYDLDISYEVFLGGKQINNFVLRHGNTEGVLHPKKIDTIYINANSVIGLQNSTIYIPAERYFVYKIEDLIVVDSGSGYCAGQEIFVDTDLLPLRLRVAEILYSPYKEIGKVVLGASDLLYEKNDPAKEKADVVTDSLNNIDDEYNVGYYDKLTQEGITKPATISLDSERYRFVSHRFDDMTEDNRNATYMYPDVDMSDYENAATNGDPDGHWYLGSRIDNSQHPMEDERVWNGILNTISPTHPFIPDDRRVPTDQPIKGEYQFVKKERFHNSIGCNNDLINKRFDNANESLINNAMIEGDFVVPDFASLPKHREEYPDGRIGKIVIVEKDETNDNHRMAYRIRTFIAAGFFVYDLPELADYSYNEFIVDWMDFDWYVDAPTLKAQYSTAPWYDAKSYQYIQEKITDGKFEKEHVPELENNTSYITDLTLDDISVFNWTTKEWEDLHDETRWKLKVYNDDYNKKWGFKLTFLEKGNYSYDMRLYLNKVPNTQMKNADLKRNAIIDVVTSISYEVNKPAVNTSVYTGRHLRIRKLFPYEQKETFLIGKSETGNSYNYEMNFKLNNYMHFRNQIHLEDVKIFNKSAGIFENILDPRRFEVRFKDPKANNKGYETQTKIIQTLIGNPGLGFVDGEAWAYNKDTGIHVFGRITADFMGDGHITSFTPIYCPNMPEEDLSLEFQVYQSATQSSIQVAIIMIEFHTDRVEVFDDGYIHNVNNRLAPIPEEFKVIVKYNLEEPQEYDIIISKGQRTWTFIENRWMMLPTFHLDDYNIQSDRLYVLTDKGRFPLVNPSTGNPTLNVVEKEDGTDVTLLNIYRRYEHFDLYSTPYPMRSVYVQRNIPKHGFIDLKGKLNKPLNKKYFEFWVNGKLLFDEVTIISPTKLFLHGLTSLKNLEIIEINRDPNEYFSDSFLEVEQTDLGRPYVKWNYQTYLDGALEGTLEGDNYTTDEQSYLLSPVWPQVDVDNPEYKNYPENVDNDPDILIKVNENDNLTVLENPIYKFLIVDAPTIEGKALDSQNLSFEHLGFIPVSDDMIIDMLNEEWHEEIEKESSMTEHFIMSDDEWYGMTARLYDEYGILVHNLNEAAYSVSDVNLLKINASSKLNRIVKNKVTYDLD